MVPVSSSLPSLVCPAMLHRMAGLFLCPGLAQAASREKNYLRFNMAPRGFFMRARLGLTVALLGRQDFEEITSQNFGRKIPADYLTPPLDIS